jgi:hypothetical protein
MGAARHGHYSVPLRCCALACILEIQTGAMRLAVRNSSGVSWCVYSCNILAFFNYLTPSGRITVTGRVVEVTPTVTGQIVAIPVKPNVPVKANDRCRSEARAPKFRSNHVG